MPQQKRRSETHYRPVRVLTAYDSQHDRAEDRKQRSDPGPRLGPYEFRYPVELGYTVQTRIAFE